MAEAKSIEQYLRAILDHEVESDIVSYINSMQHIEDLEEFMEGIVDRANTTHVAAYQAIRNILFGAKQKPNTQKASSSNTERKQTPLTSKKGKTKFSDINTFKEKKREKEGRQICDCEGQIHEFMNNCLNCGRIHCVEECPGPCFFCGEMIYQLGYEINETSRGKQKNKLSMTARHKENKVFDDDNDYFKSNKKKDVTKNKRTMVIALDFATRKVIESSEEDVKIKNKLHRDIKKHLENVQKLYRKLQKQSEIHTVTENNNDLIDLMIQMRHKKVDGTEDLGEEDNKPLVIDYGMKIYDENIISNTDHGLCLSLHQPYASLLVAGVKKHEGRTWKTNHRGRLWIAAAAKVPDEDEICLLENFYRQYYNDDTLKFPRDYPTSCLLGCVYIDDCLDQETYRKQFPNGESSSPFVLICSNPVILPIFYPIVGQHKIYPLDKELHNCAKLSIRHAKYVSE